MTASGRRLLVLGNPVLPMTPGAPAIPRGAVLVEDGVVTAVGPRAEVSARGSVDATLGGDDHLVLPGLINGHHHAGRTFRSGLPDIPFERRSLYLHLLVAAGTEESLYRNTLFSCLELLRAGVTSAAVIFYPNAGLPMLGAEAALRAYLDSGMRVAFGVAQRDRCLYVHEDDERFLAALPPELAARVRVSAIGRYSSRSLTNDDYFGIVRQLSARWHGREGRIRIDLCPDWFPSCTDELYLESRRIARELGTQVQTHLLETRYEMLMARRQLGRSAVEHLYELGVLGPDLVCAHSVWLTRQDIDLYAQEGAIAVHNPASNLRLASGVSPVADMLARGVTVAFGCDGLAFADDNDLLSDLRLADQLQRTPGVNSERIPSRALLEMATLAGARAVGMANAVGQLTRGYQADLVLLKTARMASPYVHPATPVEDLVLWRAQAADVDTVLVGGRVLVRDGRATAIDEAGLSAALAEDAQRAFAGSPAADAERTLALDVEPHVVRLLSGWDWPEPEAGYRYNTR